MSQPVAEMWNALKGSKKKPSKVNVFTVHTNLKKVRNITDIMNDPTDEFAFLATKKWKLSEKK